MSSEEEPPAELSSLERRVVDEVDVGGMIEAARRLIRAPSWNGNETRAQDVMRDLMADVGLSIDRWILDLAAVQTHPACSWEIERTEAVGLVGTLEGVGGGRSLVLNGHVDVVPPGDIDLWTHPPFAGEIQDGRLYGRGALDMKGPLAAGLYAIKAIRDSGVALSGSIHLQSVIGEEDGGIGTLATLLRGHGGDGAIVMEPTGGVVAPVQAGCLNFRVRVSGKSAHGAVRDEGVSAFEKLFDLYGAIRALETRRNDARPDGDLFRRYVIPFPISIGTMRGGDWASSVPEHATIEGRMGVRPDEDPADARRELQSAVRDAATDDEFLRDHPPVVEWWGGRFLSAETDPDHPLVRVLCSAEGSLKGQTPSVEGVPFGADAGLIRQVGGIPTVLYGAGDIRRAHRPDEWVGVDELTHMAQTLAVTALRFCAETDLG
ncbi:MAG: ArgE/DapE family deacylase [Gemmatimonadetes bacterium]|nr:ArgE/DapE family deacylase [Gemmatimonadota bacterium]